MLPRAALPTLTFSAPLSSAPATVTRAKARAKHSGVLSTVAAARTLRLPLVGLQFTRRCSKRRVPVPTATLTTTLRALSLAPVVIIR